MGEMLPLFSFYVERLLASIRVLVILSAVNFNRDIDSPTVFKGSNFHYASRFAASQAVNNDVAMTHGEL